MEPNDWQNFLDAAFPDKASPVDLSDILGSRFTFAYTRGTHSSTIHGFIEGIDPAEFDIGGRVLFLDVSTTSLDGCTLYGLEFDGKQWIAAICDDPEEGEEEDPTVEVMGTLLVKPR